MTTGSAYSSSISEIGAYNPSAAPNSGLRKIGGLGTDDSGYQGKDNPQFSPLGDAVLPLMIMAILFAGITYLRNKRKKTTQV